MSSQIPYYGPDHRLLATLSSAKAERYVAQGTARAIRARDGTIRRLYRLSTERVHSSIGAAVGSMHAAASQTTQRLQYGDDGLTAAPWVREHRKMDPGWPGGRHDGDEQHEQEGRPG